MTHGKPRMPLDLRARLGFVSDAIGRIMVVVGFFLLIAAVALFSKAYQWSFAAALMLGVFLIVFGIVLHYESLTLKVPSKGGLGTILMCTSTMFLAGGIVAALFAVPGSLWAIPFRIHGGTEYVLLLRLDRPNAWLTPILMWIGVGLFVFGFLLKFSGEILS